MNALDYLMVYAALSLGAGLSVAVLADTLRTDPLVCLLVGGAVSGLLIIGYVRNTTSHPWLLAIGTIVVAITGAVLMEASR